MLGLVALCYSNHKTKQCTVVSKPADDVMPTQDGVLDQIDYPVGPCQIALAHMDLNLQRKSGELSRSFINILFKAGLNSRCLISIRIQVSIANSFVPNVIPLFFISKEVSPSYKIASISQLSELAEIACFVLHSWQKYSRFLFPGEMANKVYNWGYVKYLLQVFEVSLHWRLHCDIFSSSTIYPYSRTKVCEEAWQNRGGAWVGFVALRDSLPPFPIHALFIKNLLCPWPKVYRLITPKSFSEKRIIYIRLLTDCWQG